MSNPTTPEMVEVESSQIHSAGHDESTNTLFIKFRSGHTYTYDNVTKQQYDDLMSANSPGKYLSMHIKPRHEATLI